MLLLTPSVHSADLLLHESHIYKPLEFEGRIHNKGIDVKEPGTGRKWDGTDTEEKNIKNYLTVYLEGGRMEIWMVYRKAGKWDYGRNTKMVTR